MRYKKQRKNLVHILLSFLLVTLLFAGCENENNEVVEQPSEEVTEQPSEEQQPKETAANENNEGDSSQAEIDYSVDIDIKDYTIGMTFPIVKLTSPDINDEYIQKYLDFVYNDSSEYVKSDSVDTLHYNSVDGDERGVTLLENNSIRMMLLNVDEMNEIENVFGKPLNYANDVVKALGYESNTYLLQINNIATNYDNYTVRSDEPLYDIEYVYVPKVNNLFFSAHLGGNNVSIVCTSECAVKVIDNINFDMNNIGEATVNFGYKEAVEVVEDYGLSEDDIIYTVFVYSNVFSDDRSEYIPVWEFGFQDTKIHVDAENGQLHDFLPAR